VYVDHFAKKGITNKWQVLYIDRENLEHRTHEIEYHGPDNIVVNGEPSSVTPKKIYDRWARLWEYTKHATLPPRDYTLQFSLPTLQSMAEVGMLNKKEADTVAKGKLVDKGDFECRVCPYKSRCWTTDV
jgi:hypothetical protein